MSSTTEGGLPDNLAALLARHNVPPTVDALLEAIRQRAYYADIHGRFFDSHYDERWFVSLEWSPGGMVLTVPGDTALLALARAFAAMVGGGRS